MPFGSYDIASKQFERSVTAVQKMLGGFGTMPILFMLQNITSCGDENK
jgi:hypothetical protein